MNEWGFKQLELYTSLIVIIQLWQKSFKKIRCSYLLNYCFFVEIFLTRPLQTECLFDSDKIVFLNKQNSSCHGYPRQN